MIFKELTKSFKFVLITASFHFQLDFLMMWTTMSILEVVFCPIGVIKVEGTHLLHIEDSFMEVFVILTEFLVIFHLIPITRAAALLSLRRLFMILLFFWFLGLCVFWILFFGHLFRLVIHILSIWVLLFFVTFFVPFLCSVFLLMLMVRWPFFTILMVSFLLLVWIFPRLPSRARFVIFVGMIGIMFAFSLSLALLEIFLFLFVFTVADTHYILTL